MIKTFFYIITHTDRRLQSQSPLSPVATVEHAVANGLGQMVNLHTLRPVEVGNGACNLQDAAVSACREREAVHGCTKNVHAVGVGLRKQMDHALRHLRVAMNALIGPEALSLYGACLYHPLAYGAARLTRRCLGDVLKGHGHDLTLNVDAV